MNRLIIPAFVLIAVVAIYLVYFAKPADPGFVDVSKPVPAEIQQQVINDVTYEERGKIAEVKIEQAMQSSEEWPSTPKALLEEFWHAIHEKDIDRATLLVPGSTEADFQNYYMAKDPPTPAKKIGKPEPHPTMPDIKLYPVTVDFPFQEDKVIKMAIMKLDNEKLFIDGRYTIWW